MWPFGRVRQLIPLIGGQPLSLPGSREGTQTALQRRHLLRPDHDRKGPGGGGGEGSEVSAGLGWVDGQGSGTGVRCAVVWLLG